MNKMTDQSVSIILPTYNRSILLKDCIGSVLAQTYSNWELIISDDGSTDGTALMISELSSIDNRIRCNFNSKNEGLPKNRNIAISLAKNELIFFIEDDLILDNRCLENLICTYQNLKVEDKRIGAVAPRLITKYLRDPRFIEMGENKISTSNSVSKFDRLTGCRSDNFDVVFNNVVDASNIHACSLFPKEILREVGGYEEYAYKGTYAYEEVDLNCRIRKKGYRLYFESNAIAYHFMAKVGGCRYKSQFKRDVYYVRNHIIFLIRIFGINSIYMIPLFLILKVFPIVIKETLRHK